MIFNLWRPYPLLKPKKNGWYSCTINPGNGGDMIVMDLYFDAWAGMWVDKRRKQVFVAYKVYKPGREPLEYNRVREDSLCTSFDVVAWKKVRKPCRLFGRR